MYAPSFITILQQCEACALSYWQFEQSLFPDPLPKVLPEIVTKHSITLQQITLFCRKQITLNSETSA